MVPAVLSANPGLKPTAMKIGQELTLPENAFAEKDAVAKDGALKKKAAKSDDGAAAKAPTKDGDKAKKPALAFLPTTDGSSKSKNK